MEAGVSAFPGSILHKLRGKYVLCHMMPGCCRAESRQLRSTKPRSSEAGPIKKHDWKPIVEGQAGNIAHRQRSCVQIQDVERLACFRGPQEPPGLGRWKVGAGTAYPRQDEEDDLAHPKTSNDKGRMQDIDRAWGFMKNRIILNQNSKVGSTTLLSKIRSAHYAFWNRGRDMWECTGELLSWHMSQNS